MARLVHQTVEGTRSGRLRFIFQHGMGGDANQSSAIVPGSLRRRTGLLTQEFGRYDLTIRDSVRLGTPEPVSDEQIWAALEAAHIGDLVRGLPDGLDTQLGPQFAGIGLSGGQWQRLALARIHLRDAGIWILDEPTSAIDAEAEQQIFAELQRDKASRITIVTSHAPGPSATWTTSTSSIMAPSSSTAATRI